MQVGSGMNDSRAKLQQAMKLAVESKITKIVVEHKDRLIRFNFNILKIFFESHGVEVEYVEETLPQTYEAELIEDMLSLMASFSAKIYSKRSAEKRHIIKQSHQHWKEINKLSFLSKNLTHHFLLIFNHQNQNLR
jgi:predicted site-specific integrase-resolvase